jgi:glycosyltransferase involved in cell wall biosynthesis
MKPLVSIIIPTYNRAHFLNETIDSILSQTYTNWECIVVDDGSTDDTEELLQKFCKKDKRIRYYHRPQDRPKGANACRNFGFEVSNGAFINWFDSDDLMEKFKIETQVNQLLNSKYDFVICQTMMFDVYKKKELGLRAHKLKSENIFQDYVLQKIFWLTGAPLWRKEFLKKNKLTFDERLQQAQDYDFHMNVLSVSTNYLADEKPLVLFRQHEENMSNSTIDNTEKYFSNILVLHNLLYKHSFLLDNNIVLAKFTKMIQYYKVSIRRKNTKIFIFCFKSLMVNINKTQLGIFKKTIFVIQLSVSFLAFNLFGKGNRFLKFKI